MAAVSRARSVAEPTAMPTSASARTGPSLRPSPTIATASYLAAVPLQGSPLGFRGQCRLHVVDPGRDGNPLRRSRKITGQQHHVQPAAAQRIDRRARLGKQRIVERQHGANPLAPADIDHRITARLQRPPVLARALAQATSPGRPSRRRSQPPPALRPRPLGCRGRARSGRRAQQPARGRASRPPR